MQCKWVTCLGLHVITRFFCCRLPGGTSGCGPGSRNWCTHTWRSCLLLFMAYPGSYHPHCTPHLWFALCAFLQLYSKFERALSHAGLSASLHTQRATSPPPRTSLCPGTWIMHSLCAPLCTGNRVLCWYSTRTSA